MINLLAKYKTGIIASGMILAVFLIGLITYKTTEKLYSQKLKKEQIVVNYDNKKSEELVTPTSDIPTTTPHENSPAPYEKKDSANKSPQQKSSNGSGSSTNNDSSSNQSSNSTSSSNSNLPSCGSNYSFFTASPLNQTDFKGLVPLGNLNPTGHTFPTDHIYFYLNDPLTRYNLYSPSDVTVTQIAGSEHVSDGFTDYSFTMQPCQEFKAQYGHVSSLSDKLSQSLTSPYDWENTYSTGGKTYRMFSKNVSLAVTAGEQLGTAGGNTGQNALDMNAYDSRVTLNFANYSRFSQRDTIHTVCPISYYSGDLKNTLMSRFGDYDGDPKRSQEPVCGTIEQDVSETAQGMWFKKGTTTWQNEDEHLALVHDNIYPDKAKFSVGTSTNITSGAYEFTPQSSGLINRDFRDIRSDSNIYCFEPLYWEKNKIILQLPTSTTLKVEKQSDSCGPGPWSFTGSVSEFER